MANRFPDPDEWKKISELDLRRKADPRHLKKFQLRPKPPVTPPVRIRRSPGSAGETWGLTRTMNGYYCVEASTRSIQGRAPKWIIERKNDGKDFNIAKLGSKNGRIEVLTELFNNELGKALGFPMAHHGIARLDEHLYFVTKNFTHEGIGLVHGSLLIADALQASIKEVDAVFHDSEQQFYEISMVEEAIRAICGKDSDAVFQARVCMLVFDALIGCSDRHTMNWGVLRPERETDDENGYTFAPIFD